MLIDDLDISTDGKVDKRHLQRMAMVQALFIDEFPGQSWQDVDWDYDVEQLAAIRRHKADYDQEIAKIATERPLSELSRVDLTILRLMLHESKTKDTPVKVLIDEGVELAKDFGGENSYAFVNAVLEKMLLTGDKKAKAETIDKDKKADVASREKQNA